MPDRPAHPVDPWVRAHAAPSESGDQVELAGVPCSVSVADTDPDSADAQWSADRQVVLSLADDVSAEQLARLLPPFADLARERADRPTAAVLTLPSRAIDHARVTRAAGFASGGILAVRELRPDAAGDAAELPAGIVVRDASADDAAAVAALWCDQADYEARVGTLRVSPAIRRAIGEVVPGRIAGPATVLVAQLSDGDLAGVVLASAVGESAWLASMLTLGPASYLDLASAAPARRGRGLGSALVRELHRRQRAASVAASAVHYSTFNPLSVPFWTRHGYRPALTHYALTVRA